MGTPIELDEQRRNALEQVARRRKVPVRRLLERAVDEFIERASNEELLNSSPHAARRSRPLEKDAAGIARARQGKDQKERFRLNAETIKQAQRSGLTEDDDIEGVIKNLRKKRLAKA